MEKRTTQRIIGVLVVMALVIILLPLLFDGTNTTAQTASIKAPPFPDQQTQTDGPTPATYQTVAAESPQDSVTITSSMANSMNGSQAPAIANDPMVSQPVTTTAPTNAVVTASPETLAANGNLTPPTANVPAAAAPQQPASTTQITDPQTNAAMQPEALKPIATPTEEANASINPIAASKPEVEQVIPGSAAPIAKVKNMKHELHHVKVAKVQHTTKQNLTNLKSTAWAVQMGSFKVKANAVRLANELRAHGYKAFTREIKSSHGSESMRVYVGPEFKQASAASLVNKIQQEINMRGIIVAYQPLEL